MTQLKEDIETARRNDFGRKLFEAFANEYANSYLNEKSEVAKLMQVVALKDKQLAEANQAAEEKQTLAESKEATIKKMVAESERKETINPIEQDLNVR